jgi:zinc transport system ATP-binding protein
VSFGYDGQDVLKNVNLQIHRGDYLGLVGSNGSGKSTLIKIILGLLKPDRGTVKLFGQEQSAFKEWSKIGYVAQRATQFDVNFPVTVQQVVMMGRYSRIGLLRRPTALDRKKTKTALEHVELWKYRNRLMGDLSGGQQQRVFIARALVSDPEILFLDEPTVSVDEQIKHDFYQLLRKLNDKLHLTIILITHDSETIAKEVTHMAFLDGRIKIRLNRPAQ